MRPDAEERVSIYSQTYLGLTPAACTEMNVAHTGRTRIPSGLTKLRFESNRCLGASHGTASAGCVIPREFLNAKGT